MVNAIGYHTYAGGLACGVAKHFTLVGLGEHDGYGDAIKALNFPGVPLYSTYADWPRSRGRGARATPFIFANPPCAPFSGASAGRATTWEEDPRLQHFKDIFALLPQAEPDVMAIESVTASWSKARVMHDGLAATAASHGYSTTVLLHNARFLGSVQERRRVFFVFHRVAVNWDAPNFDPALTVGKVLKPIRVSAVTKKRYAAEVALSDRVRKLYDHAGELGVARLSRAFNDLNDGEPIRNAQGKIAGRPGFLTCRLNPDRYGPVFMGSNHILHPTEPRALYPEEINAYVGLPMNWRWPDWPMGKISVFASQGVSPIVGDWLAKGVAASIDRGKRLNRPAYWLRDELTEASFRRGPMLLSDDPESLGVIPPEVLQPPHSIVVPSTSLRKLGPATSGGRPGSGQFIRDALVAGRSTADILAAVHEKFPSSKATASDVAWNRGRLRKEGVVI